MLDIKGAARRCSSALMYEGHLVKRAHIIPTREGKTEAETKCHLRNPWQIEAGNQTSGLCCITCRSILSFNPHQSKERIETNPRGRIQLDPVLLTSE